MNSQNLSQLFFVSNMIKHPSVGGQYLWSQSCTTLAPTPRQFSIPLLAACEKALLYAQGGRFEYRKHMAVRIIA